MTTAQEYFDIGNEHFDNREYEDAIECYSNVINLVPNFVVAYYNRGLCYYRKGKYEQATIDFSKAISINPNEKDAYIQRAECYSALGIDHKAIEDYTEIIRLDPYNTEGYELRASRYEKNSEYNYAIADYTKIIALDPINAVPFSNRAKCYMEIKEYNKALNNFNKSIELDPENVYRYKDRADCYIKLEQYDNAMKDLAYCTEHGREVGFLMDELFYSDIFKSYICMEKFDHATTIQLTFLSPYEEKYYRNRALCCIKMKKFNKALDYMKKTLEYAGGISLGSTYCDTAKCYNLLSKHTEEKREYRNAIKKYTQTLNFEPPATIKSDSCLWIANCYSAIEEYDDAIEYLTKRIEISLEDEEPDSTEIAECYMDRASCYDDMNNTHKAKADNIIAIKYLTKAIDKYESDNDTGYFLACCYEKRANCYKNIEEHEKARQDYQNAIENFKEYNIASYRANCYKKIGEYKKAIDNYSKAIDYYYADRADCYEKIGEHELAIADYKKALVFENESISKILYIQEKLDEIKAETSMPVKIFDNPEFIMDLIERPIDEYEEDDDDYDDDYDESDDDYNEEYEDEEYNSDECKEHMNSAIKYLLEEHKAKKAIVEIYKAYELDREFVSTLVNEIFKSDFPTEIKITFSSALDLFKQGEDAGMSSEEILQKLEQIFNEENNIDVSKLHYNPKQGRKLDL